MSKESHVRQLQRELSTVQSHRDETQEKASTVEERVKQLEVELRDKDWTHTDAISTLEARYNKFVVSHYYYHYYYFIVIFIIE